MAILNQSELPLLLRQLDRPIESVIIVRSTVGDERDLFYLANAEFNLPADRRGDGFVEIRHTWARDAEGSPSHIANFAVSDVKLESARAGEFSFTAWLVDRPKFYTAGADPFAGAIKNPGTTRDANHGYPYLPPPVLLPGLAVPTKVKLVLAVGTDVEHWVTRLMAVRTMRAVDGAR